MISTPQSAPKQEKSDQTGQSARLSTVAKSDVKWTVHVDLPTGVALWQEMESKTEQTVTLPDAAIPSRTGTVLERTTRKAP